MIRPTFALAAGALFVVGCAESPTAVINKPAAPAFEILDAAHNAGNPHFFFLPPMVPQPTYSGTADPALTATVTVCDWNGSSCNVVVAQFTVTAATDQPKYNVNWHTDQCLSGPCTLDPTRIYRLSVTVPAAAGALELGHADFQLFANMGQAKNLQTNDDIALVDGKTLPVQFRIETGIIAQVAVTPATASVPVGGTQAFSASATDLHGQPVVSFTPTWSSSAPATASVDASGMASGLSAGTATISARVGAVVGTAQISVVPAGLVLASLSAGDRHTCGLTADGTGYCWGANSSGELGVATFNSGSARPQKVPAGFPFAQIAASSIATCGLSLDGTASCWGYNGNGGVGDGTNTDRATPTAVATAEKFIQLTDHGGSHCGLATDHTAWCWGRNYGSLPIQISTTLTFTSIYGGGVNDCGLTPAQAAYCWGETFGPNVRNVGLGHTFTSLTLGQHHACGLDSDGLAWCWGNNDLGEFGDGTTTGTNGEWAIAPNLGGGGMRYVMLRAGEPFTCGLTSDGTAYCWGDNSRGQIGDGTTTSRLSPTAVATSLHFSAIIAGQSSTTCGMTADGAAYCWGANESGQLGDGTFADRLTPVRVLPPSP